MIDDVPSRSFLCFKITKRIVQYSSLVYILPMDVNEEFAGALGSRIAAALPAWMYIRPRAGLVDTLGSRIAAAPRTSEYAHGRYERRNQIVEYYPKPDYPIQMAAGKDGPLIYANKKSTDSSCNHPYPSAIRSMQTNCHCFSLVAPGWGSIEERMGLMQR